MKTSLLFSALVGRVARRPLAVVLGVCAVSLVAGLFALRLDPSAATDTLVDRDARSFDATERYRDRFGGDPVIILVRGDLTRTVLTEDLQRLVALEGCLSGNVPKGAKPFDNQPSCAALARHKPVQVVYGPGTFINEAVGQIQAQFSSQLSANSAQAEEAAKQARSRARKQGRSGAAVRKAGEQAKEAVQLEFLQQAAQLAVRYGIGSLPQLNDPDFVYRLVFDPARGQGSGTPKARFAYLFPNSRSALIQVRLKPGLSDSERHRAIDLIEQATKIPKIQLEGGQQYVVTGAPVIVDELTDSITDSIVILLLAALLVMAGTLALVFRSRPRLLPLGIALAAAGLTFGAMSLAGASLTMASIAVLPVLIGLAVDYAIQFQSRHDEEAARGDEPGQAARRAAALGAPTIATAGAATAVGFLVLLLSPVPMVRSFGLLLVIGIVLAFACALTLGAATLVLTGRTRLSPLPPRRLGAAARGAADLIGPALRGAVELARPAARRLRAAGPASVRFLRARLHRSAASRSRIRRALVLALDAAAVAAPFVLVHTVLGVDAGWPTAGLAALGLAYLAVRRLPQPPPRPWWPRVVDHSVARPWSVLGVACVLAVAGWGLDTQTKVVSDIQKLVPQDMPALRDAERLQSSTGVSGEIDVIVEADDLTDPEVVGWMRDYQRDLLKRFGYTSKTGCGKAELCPALSLPDLFRTDDAVRDQTRIRALLDAVPAYFSQAVITRDRKTAALAFGIRLMPFDRQKEVIDEMRSRLDPPEGVRAELAGLPVLAAEANHAVASDWRRALSLVAGLLAVALVLLVAFRRAERALVPLIPIALATGWSALVLFGLRVPLNPMSVTLGALVIAISTEFSVLLSERYRQERAAGHAPQVALGRTYRSTGAAVVASGATAIAGFAVLMLSDIRMLRDFGFVTVIDLGVSLVGVLVVLPAVLVLAERGELASLPARLRPRWPRRRMRRPRLRLRRPRRSAA